MASKPEEVYAMNKKVLWLILAVLVIAGVAFYVYRKQHQTNPDHVTVKIGMVLPLTGNGAQYGQYFKQGSELAVSDAVNEGLIKSDQIRLVVEDGKGDPAFSLSAFKKLVETDGITASLVDLSGVILAIKPEANKDSVVLINSSSFSTDIEDRNDFIYSVLPNASIYGDYIGSYCVDQLGMKKAGVLYRTDPLGVSFDDSFKKSFTRLGGQIVFENSHKVGESDFRTLIETMRGKDVDMIFVASYGPEIANFAKQARELNFKVQIVTYQGFFIREALEIAQDSANGIICIASTFDPYSTESRIAALRAKLKAKYN